MNPETLAMGNNGNICMGNTFCVPKGTESNHKWPRHLQAPYVNIFVLFLDCEILLC